MTTIAFRGSNKYNNKQKRHFAPINTKDGGIQYDDRKMGIV